MISLAAAAALATMPQERAYRVTLRAHSGTQVVLRVSTGPGWVGAFCTPRVCAVGHVVVRIPASGKAVSDLHLYRVQSNAAHRVGVRVTAGDASLTLDTTI